MVLKLPYLKREGKSYPIIPVLLINKDKFILTEALLDSGANTSVFHAEIAEQLGIEFKAGKKIYLGGIGGRILAYLHPVSIKINEIRFVCKIAFTEEMPVSLNILGRENFFEKFLISFDEIKKEITLQKNH